MNIGIFTDTYFPQLNGVATSVQTLRRELEKKGHQVYIFTPYDPRQQQETDDHIFRLPSMPFIFVKNYRACFVCPPHILRKIHQLKLDIIHTQTEFSLGFLGKLISKTCGIPMVHTYHTMYEDYVHYIAGGHLISAEGAREFSRIFCNTAMAVIAPTKKPSGFCAATASTNPFPSSLQALILHISANPITTLRKYWNCATVLD